MTGPTKSRRQFLLGIGQSASLAATGGLVWSYLLRQQAHAAPDRLRPPGAVENDDFLAKCIKCGQCVRACPYDTLTLASAGDSAPIGTPCFSPREIPCYMCEDIPCQAACPTGALDPALDDIDKARMGLAVIDIENCLSWQGLRCEICHRDCPLQDQAISIEHRQRKTSRHALFVPIVHSEACTGCGICEKACPTAKAAIRVLPAELVQGSIGQHYRLGWTRDTPVTREFKTRPRDTESGTGAPPGGLEYLNEGSL